MRRPESFYNIELRAAKPARVGNTRKMSREIWRLGQHANQITRGLPNKSPIWGPVTPQKKPVTPGKEFIQRESSRSLPGW